MSVKLFEHNRQAYESVCFMLNQDRKAAVIHPTGTGKSFIGFQLAEDHCEKTVCWLSPSEHIVHTQMENWKSAGGSALDNIRFFTYARLMNLTETEMKEICPDYIVLDEFHRCGAEMWGEGVQKLLKLFADVPILGLSATAIRYLDNQRDMAEELFDGRIASEISLGEAIVRGILPTPKYVTTIFQYQKELEKYQNRIFSMRSKGIQEINQKYLDALRRTLEKADGLDVIFQRHMTQRHGKYIVFCANVEHMQEMIGYVPKWFGGIDPELHCYTVHADSPEASREFAAFKKDDSAHLKLLFCIDMLNEGVHVKGISGVILFRPTVSPIIYKQQIGRALTAGAEQMPLIIDVVNNVESLCSIDSLQEEMAAAALWLRANGRGEEIITETFAVEEQVQDCRKLFEELEHSLGSTWEQYFQAAKRFSEEHDGSLLAMPRRYVSENGLSVGSWIQTQKLVRAGRQLGTLTDSQIQRLDRIGMVWENKLELQFERSFAYAKAYYQMFGNLMVPAKYQTEDGFHLGAWISNLRQQYSNGEKSGVLNAERIEQLNSIGMCWDVLSYTWEKNFKEAVEYYKLHGTIDVPASTRTESGFALGHWLQNMRSVRKGQSQQRALTDDQIKRLDQLGMRWENYHENQWMTAYKAAKAYWEKHGNLDVPVSYCSPEGIALRKWINRQQYAFDYPEKRTIQLDEQRIRLLKEIGIPKKIERDSWQRNFEIARRYQEQFGTLDVSQNIVFEGVWIGKWLGLQRKAYQADQLTEEKIRKLEEIGFDWMSRAERQWQTHLQEAKQFALEHGNLDVPKSQKSLYSWLTSQRNKKCKGKLTAKQIAALEEIGMQWNTVDSWTEYFAAAKKYAEQHPAVNGLLDIPSEYVTEDGLKIGKWLCNQKERYKDGSLKAEQREQLEQIGVQWISQYDRSWMQYYECLKRYVKKTGVCPSANYITEDGMKLGSWITDQRKKYGKGKLSKERIQWLEQIGFVWKPSEEKWMRGFHALEVYLAQNGTTDSIPAQYVSDEGVRLSRWVQSQKQKIDMGTLDAEKVDKLSMLGLIPANL